MIVFFQSIQSSVLYIYCSNARLPFLFFIVIARQGIVLKALVSDVSEKVGNHITTLGLHTHNSDTGSRTMSLSCLGCINFLNMIIIILCRILILILKDLYTSYCIISGSSFSFPRPRTLDFLRTFLSNNSAFNSAAKLPRFLLFVKRPTIFLDCSNSPAPNCTPGPVNCRIKTGLIFGDETVYLPNPPKILCLPY